MDRLTANEESFVRLMTRSAEHARRGFTLLAERADVVRFFNALREARLFDPNMNPAPEPAEKPGTFRLPYWPALAYLLTCARTATQPLDLELAGKIMEVVREVSRFKENNGQPRDNPTTYAALAEIIGTVPPVVVALDDIDMVPAWLGSKFGNLGVAAALDRAIQSFLSSEQPANWQKALRTMQHCLAVRWEPGRTRSEEEPAAVVDAFCLGHIVAHNAAELGRKMREEAAKMFRDAVQEVFARGSRAKWSWLFRATVENHEQNHSWRQTENAVVEGLRDATLAWADNISEKEGLRSFVNDLLRSKVEMLRRVGIYVLDCRWELLENLYSDLCAPGLFAPGHRHELFGVLKNHFGEMGEEDKKSTVAAIQGITQTDTSNGDELLKNEQRRWLRALPPDYPPIVEWLGKLATDTAPLGQHPDFDAYMESSWGPGPSPYGADELVAFALDGTLPEKLNAFVPTGTWRGPSAAGLDSALGQAVTSAPQVFLDRLSCLERTKREHQYAVVSALKGLWTMEPAASLDWQNGWEALMAFFEKVLPVPTTPQAGVAGGELRAEQWLIAAIADLLHEGTKDDNRSYPEDLLLRGWALLERLADIAETIQRPGEELDAMTQAINSPKGRVIEAIFSHALRECRIADAKLRSHREAWKRFEPLFKRELQKCEAGNYEFSTLAGAYLLNLRYLAHEWLMANIERIFPAERPNNLASALSGLAYAQPTREIYALLRDGNVIEAGLATKLLEPSVRKVLVHYLMRQYVGGEEELDSPRIALLFDKTRLKELETAVWFLGSAQYHSPTDKQKARILAFWDKCDAWTTQVLPEIPRELCVALGALGWVLSTASGRYRELLLGVAPCIGKDFRVHEFLRELLRLCNTSPAEVGDIFLTLLNSYEPMHDYDDLVKSLIEKLASSSQRGKALKACERLHRMPGIPELSADIRCRA